MLTNIEKGGEGLYEKMFQDRRSIDPILFCSQYKTFFGTPIQILFFTSENLGIAEIFFSFKKELQVAGLIDIKKNRVKRPNAMIHPCARNIISISDKRALPTDECCV